ncbi:MAG: response regulator [Candidatus Omnitrophota bacterium]
MLDVQAVAKYLQMHRMTIYKLARRGELPGIKISGKWRFDKELLEDWTSKGVRIGKKRSRFVIYKVKKRNNKVLVVDDDPGIIALFKTVLKDLDCKIFSANSGEEGLRIIKKEKPAVVLLDLKLPGISGIETLRLIKRFDKDVAVIMVTAYGTLNTVIKAMKLGAQDYIAKPFDLDRIISLIAETLKITVLIK